MKHYSLIFIISIWLPLSGCDTFFMMRTTVIDSQTGEPIVDAKATLVLDKGFKEPDVVQFTSANGGLELVMNEPHSVWATLTIEKTRYQTWSTQFRGLPRRPFRHNKFVVKLVPEKAEQSEQEASTNKAVEP